MDKGSIYGRCPRCGGSGELYNEAPFGVNPKVRATKNLKTVKACPKCCGKGYVQGI